MGNPVTSRLYEMGDIAMMDIQESQADWRTDLTLEAERVLADSGIFFSFVLGERVLAVGGVAVMEEGSMFLCVLSDEARRRAKSLYLYALSALRCAREAGYHRLFTHTDRDDEAQNRWVERLGFEPLGVRDMGSRPMIHWEIRL